MAARARRLAGSLAAEADRERPIRAAAGRRSAPARKPIRCAGGQGGQGSIEHRTVGLVGSDDRHWLDIMPAAAGHESFVVDGVIESSEAHIVAAARSDHDQRFSPWRT